MEIFTSTETMVSSSLGDMLNKFTVLQTSQKEKFKFRRHAKQVYDTAN